MDEGTAHNCANKSRVTRTLAKRLIVAQTLHAIPFPSLKSGYKDISNPCNRSDKQNGGDFYQYDSAYAKAYLPVESQPTKLRSDGVPLNSHRITGKSFMVPKAPDSSALTEWKRLRRKHMQTSQIALGDPSSAGSKAPTSVYKSTFYAQRNAVMIPENPGIAAETAKRVHKKLGI